MTGCNGLFHVIHVKPVFFYCICKFQKFNLLLYVLCVCMLMNVHTYVMLYVYVCVDVKGQRHRVTFSFIF